MVAGRELDALRRCRGCDAEKPIDEYWREPNRLDGLQPKCKTCIREQKRLWWGNNGEAVLRKRRENPIPPTEEFRRYQRDWQLRKRYGITQEDFERMALSQNHLCAICGEIPSGTDKRGDLLHVDHCHDTGVVRGLLCNRCNIGISNLKHDPAILRNAAEYLAAVGATDGGET